MCVCVWSKAFSQEEVYSKRKDLLPLESKFIPSRTGLFSEGVGVKEGKQEVTKVMLFVENMLINCYRSEYLKRKKK